MGLVHKLFHPESVINFIKAKHKIRLKDRKFRVIFLSHPSFDS